MNRTIFLVGLLALVLGSVATYVITKPSTQKDDAAKPIPVPTDFIEELWYKNRIIYNLDVEVFKDSDGNGVGDFKGLTQQLDYLKNLGVDAIWLAPFQPTPNQDDGYDVADYYAIDKRLGTQDDFSDFMQQASQRDIRVIMDLVINHTSDQHPWFKAARQDKNSPYRSWYVWSKQQPKDWDKGMVFPGVQTETWSYDSVAGEYFLHRFYRFQPDLNAQNPAVQTEIRNVIRHWLNQGIAGFRLDGVPFYIELPETGMTSPEHQYEMIPQLRQFTQWHKRDVTLLGEINVEPEENKQYFGKEGGGIHMMFNFYANQYLFYALASGEVKPLREALTSTKDIPATAQWAHFLRNHDEIDLGRLSDKDRSLVYEKFGPANNMQLYDRGIRRRLAPMLNNPAMLSMAYSLLYSLPGAPVIRYGEEIGMGDDLRLKERLAIRTPMQWSAEPNAGFSTADKTVRPVIDKGPYAYKQVNVADQQRDSTSLLNQITRFIRVRKAHPEIGWGSWSLMETDSPNLLVIRYDWKGRSLMMVHNFSNDAQEMQLPPDLARKPMVNLLETSAKASGDQGKIRLAGYGYAWYGMNGTTPIVKIN
ncbi:alpha amylase catalytic region [Fibrisoma limi BUZ 3]|uniref:Alpha amylase catalytic region n=1 Tax=Fibrisoma limi BUZ 3 TaxID=1185876 RepID=I2GG80_9BACT|nr:alpha-amylase family protein [Fibrisoma limi]CCH52905.1 alpha amylase catalytic region [Fibrisoma limi BUZ 3]